MKMKFILVGTSVLFVLPMMSASAAIVSQSYTGDKAALTTSVGSGAGETMVDAINSLQAEKANLAATGNDGMVAILDNTGQYTASTVSLADLESAAGDVSGKADKVSSATSGNLAGLNSSGNLTDSGVSAASIADKEVKANKTSAITTTNTGSTTEYTSVKAVEDYVTGEISTITADLDGKADLQPSGTAGNITILDSVGQYVDSTVALSDLATKTALGDKQDKIGGGTSGTVITNTGTAGSVGSLTLGALATAAPGACSNPTNKCVLTFDGTKYGWEVVAR